MKVDHLVINVNAHYQQESKEVQNIRKAGLPYNVKKGKGTKGFKATNIWIGQEYFELITIKENDGGGRKNYANDTDRASDTIASVRDSLLPGLAHGRVDA